MYEEDNELLDYYIYLKNLQGDIIGLIDFKGEIHCTYSYDAWGKFLGAYDKNGNEITNPNSAALRNPLRYRGYYYDDETGLYYLNSRYYNPEWGTFICADGYVSTGEQIVAKNMYAYCLNNPVNYSDPSGTEPVDVDLVEGIGYILDVFEIAIQTTFVAAGYSYSTAVRPSNIGVGTFNKQLTQTMNKISNYSLKVSKAFKYIGWLTLAVDLAVIVVDNGKSDQSTEGIIWDTSVDVASTLTNCFVAAKVGAAVGTAIAPGIGTVAGTAVGLGVSFIVSIGMDHLFKKPKEAIKSWIN